MEQVVIIFILKCFHPYSMEQAVIIFIWTFESKSNRKYNDYDYFQYWIFLNKTSINDFMH